MTSYAAKMMIGLDLRESPSVHLNLGIKASEPEAALHEAFKTANYPSGVYKINFREEQNKESLDKMLNGKFPNAIFVVDKTSAVSPDGQPMLYLQYEAEEKIVQLDSDVQNASDVSVETAFEETVESTQVEEESNESSESDFDFTSESDLTSESDSDVTSDLEVTSDSEITSESDSELTSESTSKSDLVMDSEQITGSTSETVEVNESNSEVNEAVAKVNEAVTEVNEAVTEVNEAVTEVIEPNLKLGSEVNESCSKVDELYSNLDESLSPRPPIWLAFALILLGLSVCLCMDTIFNNERIETDKQSLADVLYEFISTFVEIEEVF
ncbi:hypothetical protein M3Y94_00731800 [Aphelenchoides besseyi]|nr:hypothetical protein M3Y94_00731800 [Aphelenchoides besseyi]KAI6231892.1 hypothetical protein M3Y95_00429600 [Aphelenchoides besseyi]